MIESSFLPRLNVDFVQWYDDVYIHQMIRLLDHLTPHHLIVLHALSWVLQCFDNPHHSKWLVHSHPLASCDLTPIPRNHEHH